ncbi:MAG TPA: bifunctional serine/threonine-protein kinase/formylglycine-generating enzyme family protein [Pirellulales bacterium]|nr:bifunctional serine/threonine-protein kinase/formylglycine-generating enzyme family protein [Pirellulales bacterium]
MPFFALRRYRKQLVASGLFSAAELRAFERALPRGARPRDEEALAEALVAAGKLTTYQSAEIAAGRGRALLLGNYLLLDVLGAGGMGRVFKARHRRLQRTVALKTLNEQSAADHELIERFRREAWAVAQLAHPNIVAAHDADEADGVHFLVMEYVDGPNLSDLVRRRGPLPIEEAMRYTLDAARGLAYAHAQGFVHRDVKPSNLVLDAGGAVKLLDLGLARAIDAAPVGELTLAGDVVGTAEYMAPEQAFDTHSVDARADIYGLGATLYRLVTGELMYRAETPLRLIAAHREQPIPMMSTMRDDVPRWLETLYKKMVAKEPADRPQTMDEVVSALEKMRPIARRRTRPAAGETSRAAVPDFIEASASGDDLVIVGDIEHEQLPDARAVGSVVQASSSQPRFPPLAALAALVAAIGMIVLLSWRESTGVAAPSHQPRPATSADATQALVAQWARYLGAAETETNSLGMRLALIPPGEFVPVNDGPGEARPVAVHRAFYCGVHEVTVTQFRTFVGETGYRTAAEQSSAANSWRQPAGLTQSDRHPVVEIAPIDAQAFCDWLSQREGAVYRMPTEDEWEHACRAGNHGAWWFGDSPTQLDRYAWYAEHGQRRTHQVGLLEPNPFGLHDLLGNAAEWCAREGSGFSVQGSGFLDGADGLGVSAEVADHGLRGGSWAESDPAQLSIAARGEFPAGGHSASTGFRVVREVPLVRDH